ncbi:MAG: hypothetical protein MUP17_04510 [candidate division Zixibacteria bacterium]|nr:hypothetical protein [candidate division Zixibacteria bacterium]
MACIIRDDAKIVEAGFKPAPAVLPVGQVFNPTVATPDVVSVSGPVQDRQECLSYHALGFRRAIPFWVAKTM